MKLSFECDQDPREMPTIKGMKFCEHCNKNLHDLRRKSDVKTLDFYTKNPNACVIVYQDQLDKLPTKNKISGKRYFTPYVAAIFTAAILPTLSLAQTKENSEFYVSRNISYRDTTSNIPTQSKNSLTSKHEAFKVSGRVKLRRKKTKIRAGKEIQFYQITNDALESEKVIIAKGKLKLNGRFKITVEGKYYELFENWKKDEDLEVHIDGLFGSYIDSLNLTNKAVKVEVNSNGKRPMLRGKF